MLCFEASKKSGALVTPPPPRGRDRNMPNRVKPCVEALPQRRFSRILKGMEVHFTPEQEAQLAQTLGDHLKTGQRTRPGDKPVAFLSWNQFAVLDPFQG
jgi:hypothetical protein